MTITDGILNGKKELLNAEEVLRWRPLLPKPNLQSATMVIEAKNGKAVLTILYRSKSEGASGAVVNCTATCPLIIDENGYLLLEGSVIKTSILDGKTITETVTVPSKKHEYVGHVTLLR